MKVFNAIKYFKSEIKTPFVPFTIIQMLIIIIYERNSAQKTIKIIPPPNCLIDNVGLIAIKHSAFVFMTK